jgi:predicted HicB family RNase H-like nuclease
METKRPTRGVLFVRCPEELRERIAAAAKRNLRTIGAETIYRLQESLKQTATDEAAA